MNRITSTMSDVTIRNAEAENVRRNVFTKLDYVYFIIVVLQSSHSIPPAHPQD